MMHKVSVDGQLPMWKSTDSLDIIQYEIQHHGIVLLEDISSQDEFLKIAQTLGSIHQNHDSLSNGLTPIRASAPNGSRTELAAANLLGLTKDGLFPHTDRSGLPEPPRYLGFWVEEPAPTGGASLFVDGDVLFHDLSANHPEILPVLARPGSAIFKSERGLLESSIITINDSDVFWRFRNDNNIYMRNDVGNVFNILIEAIKRNTKSIILTKRQGYLIDNKRWLHGRTHFVGERSCYRVLLNEQPSQCSDTAA